MKAGVTQPVEVTQDSSDGNTEFVGEALCRDLRVGLQRQQQGEEAIRAPFIVYVNDTSSAARFYGDLLHMSPDFEVPGYVTFDLGPGADLALWSGQFDSLSSQVPRTSEVCLALSGGPDELDETLREWQAKGVTILQEPQDLGFGRTFLAADPDGNHIRVAPQD